MKLDNKYFDFGVTNDEVADDIYCCNKYLQGAFMYLIFNLNHIGRDATLVECNGKDEAKVSFKGSRLKKIEGSIAHLVNKAFPTPGGRTCLYADDGRGYMFHLKCPAED